MCLGLASVARAQQRPPLYAEYRADAIVGRGTTAQAGVGAVIPFGVYTRLGIDGAAGTTWHDGAARGSGRVDAIARFLLDPFREAPIGVSFGGGVSVPYTSGDLHVRPYVTAVVDIEGRMKGPMSPAVQIGLGGGARIGVVLRASSVKWR
ncbi:MAG TPA: hypothetical protein VK636_17800 [Gemmatimonadaceae bacterium]|nr:hypothetical protein [Gemmatimonadaceae bacterium]